MGYTRAYTLCNSLKVRDRKEIMIAEAFEKHTAASPIRPFDLQRDLGALATLIEIAFGQELAATGSEIVQDMRQMALWGPMLWLTGVTTPSMKGFVWVENGALVGNVSLNQESEDSATWVISNVAVLPEYRGRGIAGQLLDTAVGYVRHQGGRRMLLQVRTDNTPALALYRHRGFVIFDTVHETSLARHAWPLFLGPLGRSLRPVRAADGRGIYHLWLRSKPFSSLRYRPVSAQRFRRGLWWQVGSFFQAAFTGRQFYELVGESSGEIVAYGSLAVHLLRGPYELELQVLPGQRGLWESDLVHSLLGLVEDLPRQSVRAAVSASHPEAVQTLQKLGFKTTRVLGEMALELG